MINAFSNSISEFIPSHPYEGTDFKSKIDRVKALKKNARHLGLLILTKNIHVEWTNNKARHLFGEEEPSLAPLEEFIKSDRAGKDVWADDHYQLLEILVGRKKAPYVKQAWAMISDIPYKVRSSGHPPFRAPDNDELYIPKKINFLLRLYPFYCSSRPLVDYIRHMDAIDFHLHFYDMGLIIAAAISAEDSRLRGVLLNIIQGKDKEGRVNILNIRALLLTNDKQCWDAVENLFLAAGREEGLRQTILDGMAEPSIGALKQLITMTVQHQLARFSSVVETFNVWTGLHWRSMGEKVIHRALSLGAQYLESPGSIPAAIDKEDNLEVYMALWAAGMIDVDMALMHVKRLLKSGSEKKRVLALYFLSLTDSGSQQRQIAWSAIGDKSPSVLFWVLNNIDHPEKGELPGVFSTLENQLTRIPKEKTPVTFKSLPLESGIVNADHIYGTMVKLCRNNQDYWPQMAGMYDNCKSYDREEFAKIVFEDYSAAFFIQESFIISGTDDLGLSPLTDFQREFALKILNDSSAEIRELGEKVFSFAEFRPDDKACFENILKKGNNSIFRVARNMLAKQGTADLQDSIKILLFSSLKNQRIAGLKIVRQLQEKDSWNSFILTQLDTYRQQVKSTQKEKEILQDIVIDKPATLTDSRENGFGLFDTEKLANVRPPQKPESGYFVEMILGCSEISSEIKPTSKCKKNKVPGPFSMDMKKVREQMDRLDALAHQYRDTEIPTDYAGSHEKALLGGCQMLPSTRYMSPDPDKRTEYRKKYWKCLVLNDIWEQWYRKSGLTEIDIQLLSKYLEAEGMFGGWIQLKPFQKPLSDLKYAPLVSSIITHLKYYLPDDAWLPVELDAHEWIYASLPKKYLRNKYIKNNSQWDLVNHRYVPSILLWPISPRCQWVSFERYWNLNYWKFRMQYGPDTGFAVPYREENYKHGEQQLDLELACRAHQRQFISYDEMFNILLCEMEAFKYTGIGIADVYRSAHFKTQYLDRYPFIADQLAVLQERILDIEINRGDAPTDATYFANHMGKISSLHRFRQLLEAIGKKYTFRMTTGTYIKKKKPLLARLLHVCHPLATDTQKDFNNSAANLKLSDDRWIEIAMFTPHWRPFIARYLGWHGLTSGITWLEAHAGYSQNDERETRIGKYSTIRLDAFQDGVVDVNWFNDVYDKLGKKRWQMLYKYAKFLGDSNGHARAKLYADVMRRHTGIRKVTQRFMEKRNKNYIMAYGLIPLSRTNPGNDLLKRYGLLQQFLKQSKQFGTQRQSSETRAVEIGLENLARTAGYTEPLRFIWHMEAEQTRHVLKAATQVQIDDLRIDLEINEQGKAQLAAKRKEKILKNIPAKHRKNKQVVRLKAQVKNLNEQAARTRRALEKAMLRGDEFPLMEMKKLMRHPIAEPILKNLVLISGPTLGFWKNGDLQSPDGDLNTLKAKDTLRIAHCSDLYTFNHWSAYQHYCFAHKIVQPFKQIFRELYRVTSDELKTSTRSQRYSGHQVQPEKAVALLKSRGWIIDYEKGLYKVDHHHGLIGHIYALADWFMPIETEYPTLEYIEFHNRHTEKTVPLADIPERVFSEFMRDLDLVVSVAHAGGVDPETSQSSIEMRQVLASETARLFKFTNIHVEKNHIKITGKLAEYSLHLGSGIIHLIPGGHLAVNPVHTQHRGRLFLPFMDDDPKSAEIISKMVMLANDHKIKDPTVLEQIRGDR